VQYPFIISGFGKYLPAKIETAEDLAPRLNKSAAWITSRTGVSERRVSEVDVDQMGAIVVKAAIGEKPVPDLIINASGVPKQVIPDTSVFIQKVLGFDKIPSFSVHSTCLSFITALQVAGALLKSKSHKRIVIVSADRGTRGRNYEEPESAALLGDAAAAVYLEASKDASKGMLSCSMETWPEGAHLTEVRGGGTARHPHDAETTYADNLFTMDGPQIFKIALQKVYRMINADLDRQHIEKGDIALLIPHQASGKGVRAYSKFGGFKKEQVMDIVGKTGNCVAASLPLALVTAQEEKRFRQGDLIYLVGTGAGLSIASALIRV